MSALMSRRADRQVRRLINDQCAIAAVDDRAPPSSKQAVSFDKCSNTSASTFPTCERQARGHFGEHLGDPG
jgi:hypothetical protein